MEQRGDTKVRRAGADTSLGRGLDILIALGSEDATKNGGLGVMRIAERVGREKSQVSRALKTLAHYGLVDRDAESLDYRLGWRFFTLAAHAGHQRLLEEAPLICRELVARLGETAHLSVRDGAEVLTLVSELSPSALHVSDWSGRRTPAHCTASGRALLFDHSEVLVDEMFPMASLPICGPHSPSTVAELWRRLVTARQAGFAVSDEEFESGLVSAAAPVRDFRGQIVAALNVSGPKFRSGSDLETRGAVVRNAADELSRRLGWTPENMTQEGEDD
ncbi:MAG: IclR family transcriptional regulator [Thermoleophilaceae bacterium]|nr:IclR family transcriptional regulator [Thermoleophilaceae bacterium]